MNRRNSTLWRAVATSSAQYLYSTGRALSASVAVCRSSATSGESISPKLRHSAWTHRQSRS